MRSNRAGTRPIPRVRHFFLLALFFLLAGCGNNPHPRPIRETRPDGTPWRVFYSAVGEDPRTLDPQVCYDTLSNTFVSNIYEGLLQYQPFRTDPYELMPCLAEAMPERVRNADGSESYLFHLQRGVRFHDDVCFPNGQGREVSAQDFAYTLQRIADPKTECPVLSTLSEFLPGLSEAYEQAKAAGKADYTRVPACITVLDDHTFRINLSKAYPQILYWFAMPFLAPVPREAVEYYDGAWHEEDRAVRTQFKFHPVGTGAWQLVEWSRGRLLRLMRNAAYRTTAFPSGGWKAEDEGRFRSLAGTALPFMDEVQFAVIRESIPSWLLFRQGYMDRSGISKDVFNTVLTAGQELTPKYRERGIQLYKDIEPASFYSVFNMDDPVIGKNAKLRQAISCAYDAELDNQLFHNGREIIAQQLLPPGVVGHDDSFRNPYRQYDVALAKKLLSEAGYPDGRDPRTGQPLELSLDLTATGAEERQAAQFQKEQIEQLGIRVQLNENTWARLLDKMEHGQFQIYGGSGWNADYPDAENFFALFYSKNIPPQGANHGRYNNPEYDRVFDQMKTMDNGPERMALIARLNAILTKDCPFVLNFHPVSFSLSNPWTPRITSNAMLSNGLKYTQVDPVLRSQKEREWNHVTLWPLWAALGAATLGGATAVAWARRRNV